MNNRIRWRFGALASAIALLGSLSSLDAHALGLGRISVQSALGEALRAEIDILEISADETASLRVGVAPAEAFKAAGLEYSASVVSVQVSLQKRPDGRSYLRLSSPRPITDPFVDLILEANWASGRVVRDYTMLFDPPSTRQAGGVGRDPAAPTAPLLSRPATPSSPSASDTRSSPPSAATRPAARPAPVAKAPPARSGSEPKSPATGQQVAVSKGDTAGKIAAQNKAASVSLDQMLVALLRNNPDAFINGNINRLKSGAVLDIPAEGDAQTVSAGDASRSIVAQAKDFNEFRRKLAEGVPATQVGSASREAGGKLQARVEDRAPGTATPDKLTLSKGAVQGKAAAEEAIARDRQAKDAANRVAELSKNIGDLNKLAGVPAVAAAASAAQGPGVSVAKPGVAPALPATTAPAAVPAPAASAGKSAPPVPAEAAAAPGVTAASPTPTLATTPPASPAATAGAMAGASAPAATASSPASEASQTLAAASPASASAPVTVKTPVAPPLPEPGLLDELLDNPLVLPLAGGLLLLLGGLGIYRYKKRSSPGQIDSSFLESRLQPDSFFGASGGQRIDTNEGGATGSSLVYSPSQLDAAGDVDPVAEADVYLAYGRDLQAEEILKEALRTNPTRVAVHAKLMEIYAKRRDLKGFEAIAIEAFSLTRGSGPEWAYIGEMGRELDPANLLYQPGGRPPAENRADVNKTSASQAAFGSDTIPNMASVDRAGPANSSDLDLDLDFSLGDEPEAPPAPVPPPAPARPTISAPAYQPEPTVAMKAVEDPIFQGLNMDFGATIPIPKSLAEAPMSDGLTFTSEPVVAASKAPPRPAAVAAAAAPDSGMLEFDLDSLSLDLDGPTTQSPTSAAVADAAADDPLETKFALAEEFRALGDMDGARSLADEVVAQAGLPLKNKAQAFLNALA